MSQDHATRNASADRADGFAPASPWESGPRAAAANSTLAVISRRIVSLVKEHYGKGPTHARTYHFGDVVLVLMRGGSTPVEKTLLADGHTQPVIEQRAAFQQVMQPRFRRVIEEELRRDVIAFMSTMHHDPDISAELFVLAPERRDAGVNGNHPDAAVVTSDGDDAADGDGAAGHPSGT